MTSARFAEIAGDLRERIALGEFGDAGALASETDLGQRYAVSRPTVRKALEQLRQQGLVESRQGAGWFLTGRAFHQRLALGTFRHAESAVAQAGKVVRRRVVEFGYRQAPTGLAAALGTAPGDEVLHVRSVRTVAGDPLDLAEEWVPPRLAGAISRDDATQPGIWATLSRAGHRISTVRQTITAGAAGDADTVLGVSSGTPLLLIRRLAIGPDGQPIALSDHRYLAHRFALEVEFNSAPGSVADDPPGLRSVDAGTPDASTTHPAEENAS